jgi:hypothetical protein
VRVSEIPYDTEQDALPEVSKLMVIDQIEIHIEVQLGSADKQVSSYLFCVFGFALFCIMVQRTPHSYLSTDTLTSFEFTLNFFPAIIYLWLYVKHLS